MVIGGECNYLFQCDSACRLQELELAEWIPVAAGWADADIQRMVDVAEQSMLSACARLKIRAKVIRKARAVGIIPGGAEGKEKAPNGSGSKSIRRELLDEVCLSVHHTFTTGGADIPTLPYCAFNGGTDVFVDVGNKRVGVEGLINRLGLNSRQCLHVGDQFLNTGNDYACRASCPTVWISDPNETKHILKMLLTYLNISTKEDGKEKSEHSTTKEYGSLAHRMESADWNKPPGAAGSGTTKLPLNLETLDGKSPDRAKEESSKSDSGQGAGDQKMLFALLGLAACGLVALTYSNRQRN